MAAFGRWREATLRERVGGLVLRRLAGSVTLTRDAAASWLREAQRDTRVALDERFASPGDLVGAAGVWRAGPDGFTPVGAAPPPTPAERAAGDSTLADGRPRAAAPFAAATPSGVAVALSARGSDGRAALVVRIDPAPALLALAVRRVPGTTEVAHLLTVAGDSVRVVSARGPAGAYALADYPAARIDPRIVAVLRDAAAAPPLARGTMRDADGRPVYAVAARIPGTRWAAVRQLAVAEVQAPVNRGVLTEVLLLATAAAAVGLGALAAGRAERVRREREVAAGEARLAATLRASAAAARAFVEHSPYGICRVAPDGRFVSVNPALVAMLGYPDDRALLAADLGEIYVDAGARAALLGRHAAGEAVVSGLETVWRGADGRAVPVRLHSREVRDAAGHVDYYDAFVMDLGPLRDAEQALRQAEKLAAVGRFVSGVAHELNNPLAAVLLFTDGLLDEPDGASADREALGLVREQALRARAIVRDLLTFVRGAGGPTEPVDAGAALLGAARALAPQVAAAGGRLDLALGADLGWLRADRAAVEQVVTNLVVNALQAARGGVVRLAAERRGGALVVTVDDEGPGIAPEVAARMFEPFFTTKPVGAGTGLGLSVSLGIVERYGGTLAGGNRAPGEAAGLGGGARFTLTLPSAPDPRAPADAAAGAAAGAPPPGAGPPNGRPPGAARRLLVVDDEPAIRQALVRFFGRRAWQVDEAGDGRAAFALLLDADARGAPYDLVLSDVRMPDVSGVALHDWLARTRPGLLGRVVFATGDDAADETAAFVRRTGCRVIHKPFDTAALAALAADPADAAAAVAAAAARPA